MTRRGGHILLVGLPGSGKSTVGRALADRLGRAFFDADELVHAAAEPDGGPVRRNAALLAASRVLDAAAASRELAVVAVPAALLRDERACARVAASGDVVWLRARPETLAERTGSRADAAELAALGDACAHCARLTLEVEGRAPGELARTAIAGLARRARVEVAPRGYDVLVGPGVSHLLPDVLPASARRAAVVTQEGIGIEVETGLESIRFPIGEGEAAKSLRTVEELCRGFALAGLTRRDVVVAVGGGVVTDVAGFAAACYHRGVAVVHVPTTLLAQVDAAIGGKSGVNLPEGKNLVGAFWQPDAVLCDTDTLESLPEREWRSGLGEMAKYAFLGAEGLEELPLVDQVARCAALKAEVVTADERESGRRMTLNYGHTLAHALEAAGFAGEGVGRAGVDLRHGEAVAIGLVFAARLAEAMGRIDRDRVARHLAVVTGYGLPAEVPAGVDAQELITLMGRDKKATDGLVFALDGPRGVEPVAGVDPALVRAVLEASGPGSAAAFEEAS